MIDFQPSRIISFFLGIFLIVYPLALQAGASDTSSEGIEPDQTSEVPRQMTLEEINQLVGEDPYLGQTSYLQSPDGFSQRKNSKSK